MSSDNLLVCFCFKFKFDFVNNVKLIFRKECTYFALVSFLSIFRRSAVFLYVVILLFHPGDRGQK